MTIINHECYVSLEVAKLLKEVGFDWSCNHAICCDSTHYPNLKEGDVLEYNYLECSELMEGKKSHMLLCPTLDVAQRWSREVKGIYIEIVTLENKKAVTNSDGWTFHYEYGKPTFDCDIQNERCETISTLDDSFDTYEEAQESGIKKALELILEKGE